MYHTLSSIINEDLSLYTLILQSSFIDTIFEKVKDTIRDNALSVLNDKARINPEMMQFIFDYVAGGLIAVYKTWVRSEKTISMEELSKCITPIVSDGIKSILR